MGKKKLPPRKSNGQFRKPKKRKAGKKKRSRSLLDQVKAAL